MHSIGQTSRKPDTPKGPHPAFRSHRAWRFCLLLFLFSFFLPQLVAQEEAPLTDQPTKHYYHAWGSTVKVAWSLDRTRVPEDGELIATLTITGATNPQKIIRPDLKKLPEFQSQFTITDNTDPAPGEGATEVKFSYHLRPRNRSVDKVPMLEFRYYNRSAPAGPKQYPLAIARPVPITVTEVPKLEPPAIPLAEPDYLFAVTTGSQLLEKRRSIPDIWLWLVVGLAGPVCALGWFVAWQRVFPDAVRLAKMRRSRAARRAIDVIHRANRTSDPPAAIAAAVLSYLRTRFPFPPGAATPGEIESALSELSLPTPDCAAVAGFFRECDAARFAPPGDNSMSLATDAVALITRLEDA